MRFGKCGICGQGKNSGSVCRCDEQASSGNSELLLHVLQDDPIDEGHYWFRDTLNDGPWLICFIQLQPEWCRFGGRLVFCHDNVFEPLDDVQAYRHYDFAGPIPKPVQP